MSLEKAGRSASLAMSRRGFLKSSLAVGAALTAPSVLRGAAPAGGSGQVLRFGIIGTGARGSKAHIPALMANPQIQLLAACDIMEKHLQQGLTKIGKPVVAYSDYQKLLANPDIDAVMIATPNCVHKEVVLAALQAGKHVMCEKPMAVSFDECKAVQSAIAASSKTVLFCMQLRYSLEYEQLRKAIESGMIGKPKHLLFAEFRGDWNRGDVWKYNDPKQGPVNWRFSHAASGGTLSEKVCHYFDILHWMMGEHPASVACNGGIAAYKDGRDTWDHATTILTYPSGAVATHNLCMFGPKRLELQIIGEEGSLTVSAASKTILHQAKAKKEELALPEETRHGAGTGKGLETAVVRMYSDFLDCVANNKRPWMDVEKAMTSSKTAWLGELSSERKQEVKWEDIH